MTEILFYHLERGRVEDVLPGLLEKTLARGWRAMVQTSDTARVEQLDSFLWIYRDDSFLPHGGGSDGTGQPIWITDNNETNGADVLFLVDGAQVDTEAAAGFERCVLIFDGRNDDALSNARGFWKEGNGAGFDATYWKQSAQGRWEKQNV